MSDNIEKFTVEPDETASDGQVLGTTNQFYVGITSAAIQLQAFQSGSDVTVQVSFPYMGWPTLDANMSQTSPSGEIDMPNFNVVSGANAVNYTNLRVSLMTNYNESTPVNVLASLLIDVSVGRDFKSVGIVGATYVLSF